MARTPDAEAKLSTLRAALVSTGGCLVAYSGGADSTLLLSIAAEVLGDRCVAATARSMLFPDDELQRACEFTADIGVEHILLDIDHLALPGIAQNSPRRCYYCKKALAERLWKIAREHDLASVADGAVVDDADDYRPGTQAAREMGIISPLAEAGLNKADVVVLSHERELPTAGIPSMACYASRVPYGVPLDAETITRVAQAEAALRDLGFTELRVRHHGDVARIELPPRDIRSAAAGPLRKHISDAVKTAGYTYVALDMDGYRTGSLNELLSEEG